MAQFTRLLGKHRDLPILSLDRISSATAGTGTDYEVALLIVPDLTKVGTLPTGTASFPAVNDIALRDVILVPEAALTGAATNNFVWTVRQYRAGVVLNQYSLTSAASIAASANTITLTNASGTQNVRVNDVVYISGGTGTAEYVQITAVAPGTPSVTFTAANTHSGAYTIVSTALASVWYNSGSVTEAAYTAHQLTLLPHYGKPGDVFTFQRLSFGTGLASPAITVQYEYSTVAGTASSPLLIA